ncbi:hypothetical protein H6P81_012864 [Aristolochia fimbriata]|uniref:Uncharacterized protein n=1 Tax=Aristolochia fimbriata TaxID=158543 RepID=A0AAV7EEA1_ARIFI|nr:hypothetical protein H6P81_012864 [Aristolochia fimbriata]
MGTRQGGEDKERIKTRSGSVAKFQIIAIKNKYGGTDVLGSNLLGGFVKLDRRQRREFITLFRGGSGRMRLKSCSTIRFKSPPYLNIRSKIPNKTLTDGTRRRVDRVTVFRQSILPAVVPKQGDEAEEGADGGDEVSFPEQNLHGEPCDVGGDLPSLEDERAAWLPGEGEEDEDGDPGDDGGGDGDGEGRGHGEEAEHRPEENRGVERRPPDRRVRGVVVVPVKYGADEVPGGGEEEAVDEEEEAHPGASLLQQGLQIRHWKTDGGRSSIGDPPTCRREGNGVENEKRVNLIEDFTKRWGFNGGGAVVVPRLESSKETGKRNRARFSSPFLTALTFPPVKVRYWWRHRETTAFTLMPLPYPLLSHFYFPTLFIYKHDS